MKEIFTSNYQETSLTIVSSEIKAIRRNNLTHTGCRLYKDGKIGTAGSIGNIDINELFAKAEQKLNYQIDYPVEPTKNIENHYKNESCQITDKEFYNEIEKILKEIVRLHPDFVISNKAGLIQIFKTLKNEVGMSLSHFDRYINIELYLKQKGSSDIINVEFLIKTRELEPDKIIKASSELISAYTNILPFPKEPLPLILRDNVYPSPILSVFQKNLNAEVMGTGTSLFQNQFGKEVFSKDFSLKLRKINPEENFTPVFDMEGVITLEKLSYLIKNGVILRPYSDKRTSIMYGYENTGCAEGSYSSVPCLYMGRGTNSEIEKGDKTIKELLNGKMGILLSISYGGDYTADGNYASPVQLAYLTDGEKLLGRLPNFTIKSSVYDIFGKNFIGMSSDKLYTNSNRRMLVTRMKIEPL